MVGVEAEAVHHDGAGDAGGGQAILDKRIFLNGAPEVLGPSSLGEIGHHHQQNP